jgi:methyl-accepting chemotaxis protein
MNFFRNMKLSQKISLLTISFFIFLTVIGAVSIRQISSVNSKLKELNDSRLAPIIELENAKSNIEYIRSAGNSIMDASDTDTVETAKTQISSYVSAVDKVLAKYKSNSEFKTLLSNYAAYIEAKDTFIETMGTTGGKVQMNVDANGKPADNAQQQGPPECVTNFDATKTALVKSFDVIINKQVAAANSTYTESETAYKTIITGFVILLLLCAAITLILSIVILNFYSPIINYISFSFSPVYFIVLPLTTNSGVIFTS